MTIPVARSAKMFATIPIWRKSHLVRPIADIVRD